MEDCNFKITYCVEKARGIIGADPSWEKSKRFESFDDARDEYSRITLQEIKEESESIEWIREYAEDEISYKELTAIVPAGGYDIDVSLAIDNGKYVIAPPESETDACFSIIEKLALLAK